MPGTPLSIDFFYRDAETVARALIGCTLVRPIDGVVRRARLVETEAYVGEHDLACHAAKGRTRRTEVMFGPAGRAYVYLIYGMHQMLNLVTGAQGDAQAVLLRAAEPLGEWTANLSGPGRLAKGFGITPADNGMDVTSGPMTVEPCSAAVDIGSSVRVGIDYAGDWTHVPLRFFDPRSRAVSKPWPAAMHVARPARQLKSFR